MKTTLDIHDELLNRAKRRAKETARPLRALVEEGLRRVLSIRISSSTRIAASRAPTERRRRWCGRLPRESLRGRSHGHAATSSSGVVTNRRIWKDDATTPERGWSQLASWAASPSIRLIGETEDFLEILGRFARRPRMVGGVIHDARIAAVCVAHGVDELLTRDRDLSLFPEFRTRDPIKAR